MPKLAKISHYFPLNYLWVLVLYFPVDYSDWKTIGYDTVSAIGIGTWAIRSYNSMYEVLRYAIGSGKINLVDTAEMYDDGKAEELVGRVAREVGRDNIFITTKMMPHNLVSEEMIEKAARASLRRLGVEYVDLFLIHWPNHSLSIEAQVRMFEKVVYRRGYARYIGVSNFSRDELVEAIHATGSAEIVVNQVHYSVMSRWVESEILPVALRHGVVIQAYTPLERGRVVRSGLVREIALKIGKTPIQVALNYLISRPSVIAIPKTETMKHLEEIIGALGWRLEEEHIERLSSSKRWWVSYIRR